MSNNKKVSKFVHECITNYHTINECNKKYSAKSILLDHLDVWPDTLVKDLITEICPEALSYKREIENCDSVRKCEECWNTLLKGVEMGNIFKDSEALHSFCFTILNKIV